MEKYICLYLKISCALGSVLYSLGGIYEDVILQYYYFDSSEDLPEIPIIYASAQITMSLMVDGVQTLFLEPSALSVFTSAL